MHKYFDSISFSIRAPSTTQNSRFLEDVFISVDHQQDDLAGPTFHHNVNKTSISQGFHASQQKSWKAPPTPKENQRRLLWKRTFVTKGKTLPSLGITRKSWTEQGILSCQFITAKLLRPQPKACLVKKMPQSRHQITRYEILNAPGKRHDLVVKVFHSFEETPRVEDDFACPVSQVHLIAMQLGMTSCRAMFSRVARANAKAGKVSQPFTSCAGKSSY